MALTQSHRTIIAKARSLGGGAQAVTLSDEACAFLVGTIVRDLGFQNNFSEVPGDLPAFFGRDPLDALVLAGVDFLQLFARLVNQDPNADTYFSCLAQLHKSRIKYQKILETQPLPNMDQVGPRGLLQYGTLSAKTLAGFMFWRKWMYDIDNRAGQETGYLFEPIIAAAIGGAPASKSRSPVKRRSDRTRNRQVDCIRDKNAYELKLRVTIAASGQGRWKEELDFPEDCKASGYTPILVVLDPTRNPKLDELVKTFQRHGGQAYIGDDAWKHLEDAAGRTMGLFLQRYVQEPIQRLLEETPERLPELVLRMSDERFEADVGGEKLEIKRSAPVEDNGADELPDDVDQGLPGQ